MEGEGEGGEAPSITPQISGMTKKTFDVTHSPTQLLCTYIH